MNEDIRLNTNAAGASVSNRFEFNHDNNGNVYVVWQDDRNGDQDIYFNYSNNYGLTWQENDIRINTNNAGTLSSEIPHISNDENGNVYITWGARRAGDADIYFNYSNDFGQTWLQNDMRINRNAAAESYSNVPRVSNDEQGHVYVVWYDNRNGELDVYFNYSHDYGLTWNASDIRLDTDDPGSSFSFGLQISNNENGHVYVVWKDSRNGSNIYLNYSNNYGETWQENDVFIGGLNNAHSPEIDSDDDGGVYIVWRNIIFLPGQTVII